MSLADLHLSWSECTYKNQKYRTYYLSKAYREDGKNKKDNIYKLGKLTDQEADEMRQLLKALKTPNTFTTTLQDLAVEKSFDYLDVAVANEIWNYWNLDSVFGDDGNRQVPVSTVARILTINRCINPAAKSKVPEWFQGTSLHWMLGLDQKSINSSRIFRELEEIESHKEKICQHLYDRLIQENRESMKSVFYDLSSTTFTGTKCHLVKWGHCKEGYARHAVLAILVNSDGLPFYWEVLPGNTADSKTIIWLVDRLKKRLKIEDLTLVFDRGMVSDDNLTLLEEAGIKYTTAMDRNQIENKTDLTLLDFDIKEENLEQKLDEFFFHKLNDSTFYREIKVDNERRYILCFNPQLFKDQVKSREQAIDEFQEFVDETNHELLNAKKSRTKKGTYSKFEKVLKKKKLNNFVDVNLEKIRVNNVTTYQGKVVIDLEKKKESSAEDGFWLLVTNHKEKKRGEFIKSSEEVISPYRDKVVVESSFRDIKSFIEVSPGYVWTEEHVKAHYTICVLAYLIDRTLTLQLHKNIGSVSTDVVSHERLYWTLSKCKINLISVENVGLSTYNITKVTHEQNDLLDRIGMDYLINKPIKKLKIGESDRYLSSPRVSVNGGAKSTKPRTRSSKYRRLKKIS